MPFATFAGTADDTRMRGKLLSVGLAVTATLPCPAALEPFAMPWNDATAGITNLEQWQPTPAGSEGWVNVTADGHYQVNARQIRFLGVNVSAAEAFPPRERAEAHAARLARFGFNAVRFHHLEAPWDKANVLIDYAAGGSRTLSAERLERLQYFVAQLAARGIYTNLNLLVSREFQPSDGLGVEIAELGWKNQHILGFFFEPARALQREYASQLLGTPNPHRAGRTFAEDPAIAFVEIMNENGLLQKWYENVLDTLPPAYSNALQAEWNAWLKTRYAATAELLAAWDAVDEPLGDNRLANGNFANGTNNWNLERHATAVATATAGSEFDGAPSLRINATTAGSASWHVQLTQGGLTLAAGRTYTVSFQARSAASTPLAATLTRTGPTDYSAVSPSLSATLTTAWQSYRLTFQASTTEPSVRLVFNGFGDRVATVWLADIRFQAGGSLGGLPAAVTLEAGNIPIVKHNVAAGSATTAQTRDWIAFLLAAEKSYWEAMEYHVKTTLGYRGIVWGTIISNSPPNTQANLDAIDSHAYWQHPQFLPGRDFDPVEWTVANTSMVNSPTANTLPGIARQRVAGKPHNVTEYQHASPNTFTSEGPLLAAAYGALQDWDSLWMFDYATNTAEHVTGFFDHGRHPGKMTNNLIAAALFRRGDVQPAITRHTLSLPPEREIELARTRGGAWSIADGAQLDVPPALALQNQLALAIGTDASGLDEPPPAPSGDVFTSDTNQLRWDTSIADKGVVTIDTRRTKAVIGFTAGRSFDLGGVVIAPGTTRQDWCTLAVTLLAGQSFDTLGHAQGLIVATGDQENTAQVWKDATRTSVGSNWGRAPTLVEVIPATFILPVASSRVAVWALDARGARLSAVSVRDSGGRAQFDLGQSGSTLWYEVVIDAAGATAPTVSVSPLHRTAEAGAAVSFDFSVEGNPTQVQWTRNGTALVEETNPTLSISRLAPSDVGIYQALVSNASGSAASPRAILGLLSAEKVIGTGKEVGADIRHPNGNTFDQVLVTGVAEAVTADHALNQITRTSFIDSSNDIVQLEYSGPGTLSLVIEGGSGPAVPTHYNQSNVSYMKGHASIVVAGADERSHLTIFTVGRATAFDPSGRFDLLRPIGPTNDPANNGSPLFDGHGGTDYDGVADLAFIAILSTNGRFGSLRAANADFFATRGITGLFAPGVVFSGPVFLGNISAFGDATPMLRLGASGDVRITGGDLYQDNGRPVQASGLTQLKFTAGGDSHGRVRPAKSNRGVLHDNGVDITGKVVGNP